MALSLKVIAAYKESTNSVIQVEKDARIALRTYAIVFGLRVRAFAIQAMEAQKRKSLKLGDVVTGVAAQLSAEFPSMEIDTFIESIFGSSLPYNVTGKNATGEKIVVYSSFTEEQTARLFISNNGHVQVNHKNTLRISEVERLLCLSRKAHRTANAFLAICVDQYVQNLLSLAEARVTHDNKKRVKVDHLQVPVLSYAMIASLAEFQAYKSIKNTKDAAQDDETAVAVESEVEPEPIVDVKVEPEPIVEVKVEPEPPVVEVKVEPVVKAIVEIKVEPVDPDAVTSSSAAVKKATKKPKASEDEPPTKKPRTKKA
jgi:hypothetical protein